MATLCPMVCRPASGSSGCSGRVSDQCVGNVRQLIILTLSKERPGRGPPDPPHPPSLPLSGSRANPPLCVEPAWQATQSRIGQDVRGSLMASLSARERSVLKGELDHGYLASELRLLPMSLRSRISSTTPIGTTPPAWASRPDRCLRTTRRASRRAWCGCLRKRL